MAGTKLTDAEIALRVEDCYNMRFEHKYTIKQWLKHCHEKYGDKSEQQYTQYWMASSKAYEEHWKEKLNKLLDPAANELYALLADEDPKIRQRAIDQIMKYTGNDITKVEGDIRVENISLTWGDEEDVEDGE